MRNPKWHRDELILALDLYFSPDRGSIDARNPNVIRLSQQLNLLPIFAHRPDIEIFRNPNGVGLKLSNFLALDPSYKGKGMNAYSKLDKIIFEEFVQDRPRLRQIAQQIRNVLKDKPLREAISYIIDEDESNLNAVHEGDTLFRLHKYRERNTKIVLAKKKVALKANGVLVCEVCEFDFNRVYGALGSGFIECHHVRPLAQYDAVAITRMEDLALVCSNCHRMLHRNWGMTIEELKKVIL